MLNDQTQDDNFNRGAALNKQDFQKYVLNVYGVIPDFPWESNPTFAVYRHTNNRKWFALVMDIPKSRLGLRLEKGIFPAYHMSKDKWISVALDGSVDDEQIKMLLDMSYELTALKIKRKKENKT